MRIVRAHSTRARRATSVLLALVFSATALGFAAPAQSAPVVNHDRVVSAVPGNTPAVNDGEVDNMVQVGDVMVVGGTFTSVTPVGSTTAVTRNKVFAFNVSTGALVTAFAPTVNGQVNEVIAGPTAGTVYLGGAFTTVNGKTQSHVTLLNVSDGSIASTWTKLSGSNGVVNAMVLRNNHLFIGGYFSTVGGVAHAGLASLDPSTGKVDTYITQQVSVHHNNSGKGAQGPVGVRDLDVNAAGDRLVAIGNFKKVDALTRDQVVMLSLGTTSAITPDWNTTRYSPLCFSSAFDTYVRGVSFSPDGSYFVVAATGGGVTGTLCDAAARFETNAVGSDIQPTWVDYTGGDTLWSVTVTEKAVYVGGHMRWMNNSNAADKAGAGAAPRPGLAALNTKTGMPLSWNPGRNPRGAAVYALYATPTGLWMGSDTDYIGNHRYKRPRIAFFPLANGSPEASDSSAALPGTVFLGGNQNPTTATTNDLRTAPISSAGASPATAAADAGVAWSAVRGSFVAGGKLWYGKSDGTFQSRTYTDGGMTFGPEVKVDPYNDPAWAGVDTGSGNTYDGKVNDLYPAFASTTAPVTGMTYVDGKLYYVRKNDANLYWRWFNADTGMIGSQQFTANGGRNWSGTLGMFAADGKLYFVTSANGNLNSIALTASGPTGVSTVVNGPATGGTDWRTRALFLVNGNVAPANVPPTASYSQTCTDLACDFDASASKDSDGSIVKYDWDFGDTKTESTTVPTVHHDFTGSGSYQVKLTVTDDKGATTSQANTVTVTSATQGSSISFVGTEVNQKNGTSITVKVPAGTAVGDTLLLNASISNAAVQTPPAGWTLVADNMAGSTSSGVRSVVWTKTATAADAPGSTVTVPWDVTHAATVALSSYRGVSTTTSVTATSVLDAAVTNHTTPGVTVPGGSWVVSAWSEKSSAANTWSAVPGTKRADIHMASGTAVSTLLADTNGPVGGAVAGVTATTAANTARAVDWTIVLAPQ